MIDNIEKIVKIIFGSIASIAIAYASYNLNWENLYLKNDEFCINYWQEVQKIVENNLQQTHIQTSITRKYSQRCSVSLALAEEEIGEVVADVERRNEDLGTDAGATGPKYAYLGDSDGNLLTVRSFTDTNGNAIDSFAKVSAGRSLKSRWTVNMRAGPSIASRIVGVLPSGACMAIEALSVHPTGEVWASVETVAC